MTKQNLAIYSENDLQKVPKEFQLLNSDQLKFILSPTPKSQIKTRQGKGGQVWSYVNGAYCTKILNLTFGFNWDFKIVEHKFDLKIGQAFVLGELTVRIKNNTITKQQFGRADIKFMTETRQGDDGLVILNDWGKPKRFKTDQPVDIGNDLKASATDALKKCTSSFGFFSDVYHADDFKEIRIVKDEDKEAIIENEKLKTLKTHLEMCKNIEDVLAVEFSLESSLSGEVSESQTNLINSYKTKLNNFKQ